LPALNPQDTTCSNNFNAGGSFGLQYFGTGCTGGELSHLFVTDLGNKPNESVLNQAGDTAEQIANLALFTNVQSSDYWSGTEYAPVPVGAWFFNSDFGVQGPGVKGNAGMRCMPWLCAPAMWPPLCRSHRRWHWCCWRWARRWWCAEGGQFDALTLRAF